MPIKTLETFLFERKIVNSSSIEILQNAIIGIDVEHYLSRIYTYKKEQFLFGMGGIPSSLESYIQSDLKVFNEFNIRPLFVLPGMLLNSQQTEFKAKLSLQEQHLETTWNKLNSKQSYNGSNYSFANESFRLHIEPLPIRPMVNDLVKYFISNGIDYMISPYDASFQLSYLYQNKLIDSIYGSTDLLLTKIDKFILGMEFQSKDFRYVDKQKVLNELNLTERQFLDISIIVGCSPQPTTFPDLLLHPNYYFRTALDIFYQYNTLNMGSAGDLFGYVSSLPDAATSIEVYFRGHAAIKYMPVLNKEGYVELYCNEMQKLGFADESDVSQSKESSPSADNEENPGALKIPTEIHNVISQRLPPELYLYQSLGFLPSSILEAVTLGTLSVRPPLESGVAESYKKLITSSKTQGTWGFQINLITQLLARYYQLKSIKVEYWFRDEKLDINNRLSPPVSSRMNFLQLQLGSKFTLKEFVQNIPDNFDSYKRSSSESSGGPILDGSIVATSLARAFFVFHSNDKSNETQNSLKLLKRFTEGNPDVSESSLREITLLVLLLSTESYDLFSMDRSYPGVPKIFRNFGSDKELSAKETLMITLAARIFSLHKFNIHPINYQGPLSRSLLSFRSHMKFVQDLLSTSMEACLIDFIARLSDIKLHYQTHDQWYSLIDQLPFYSDLNNTLLGVVSEIYFESCLKLLKGGQSVEDLIAGGKKHLLDDVLQVRNTSFNINLNSINSVTPEQFTHDFLAGVELWDNFVLLARIAAEMKYLIKQDDLDFILATNDLIHQFVKI